MVIVHPRRRARKGAGRQTTRCSRLRPTRRTRERPTKWCHDDLCTWHSRSEETRVWFWEEGRARRLPRRDKQEVTRLLKGGVVNVWRSHRRLLQAGKTPRPLICHRWPFCEGASPNGKRGSSRPSSKLEKTESRIQRGAFYLTCCLFRALGLVFCSARDPSAAAMDTTGRYNEAVSCEAAAAKAGRFKADN